MHSSTGRNRRLPGALPWMLLMAGLVVSSGIAAAEGAGGEHHGRHYDAREVRATKAAAAGPTANQLAAIERKRGEVPELADEIDGTTGATRSLWNRVGYLTGADRSGAADEVALKFVQANLDLLGLEVDDLAEWEVTDSVYSAVTGATHLYLRQIHQGIPVYNAQLHVNVNRDGRIISRQQLVRARDLARPRQEPRPGPPGGQGGRGRRARTWASPWPSRRAMLAQDDEDPRRVTASRRPACREEPIEAKLVWLPVGRGDVRLAWNFQIAHLPDGHHVYEMTVDAKDGQVWTRFDRVASDAVPRLPAAGGEPEPHDAAAAGGRPRR